MQFYNVEQFVGVDVGEFEVGRCFVVYVDDGVVGFVVDVYFGGEVLMLFFYEVFDGFEFYFDFVGFCGGC